MNVTVVVGGKSLFTAQGAPEAAASFYGLATHSDGALAGWYEAPAPRVEEVLRPQANGAFMPHNLLLGARVITLHFYYVATSLNDGVCFPAAGYKTAWPSNLGVHSNYYLCGSAEICRGRL